MSIATIHSVEQLDKLKQLNKKKKRLRSQQYETKIYDQTLDQELAEKYAPITQGLEQSSIANQLALEQSSKANQIALNKTNEAFQEGFQKNSEVFNEGFQKNSEAFQEGFQQTKQAVEEGSEQTREGLEKLTRPQVKLSGYELNKTFTISKRVVDGLSGALNATNQKFKLIPIKGNLFTFGATLITLEGDSMIFENFECKPSYYLTDNIMKFLTSNQSTLNGFSPEEKIVLIEILTITNSLTSGDKKSPRGKALKELKAKLNPKGLRTSFEGPRTRPQAGTP